MTQSTQLSIHILEPDMEMREVFCDSMSHLSQNIAGTASFGELKEKAELRETDLIILNVAGADETLTTFLKNLKTPASQVFILVSGEDDLFQRQCAGLGFSNTFEMPFDCTKLLSCVESAAESVFSKINECKLHAA